MRFFQWETTNQMKAMTMTTSTPRWKRWNVSLKRGLVFQVAPKATKTEIKQAVQTIFKVKVFSVRTATYPGKERRRGKFAGYRPDWKKAYVRLRAGEKMPEYAQNL